MTQRDIRLKYLFAGDCDLTGNTYNPKLYIASDWNPPITPASLENIITRTKGTYESKKDHRLNNYSGHLCVD